jgi:hypothetical protein
MIIQKGGHGSGVRGHRTLGDATHLMSDSQRRMSLDRLKAELAKRGGSAGSKPAPVAAKPAIAPAKPVAVKPKPEPSKEKPVESKPKDTRVRGHVQRGGFSARATRDFPVKDLLKNGEGIKDRKHAKELVQSVQDYSTIHYENIRSGKDEARASKIEEFIAASPKWNGSGQLYRGIGVKNLDSFKVGASVDMKGASSWSSQEDIALGFLPQEGKRVIFSLPRTDNGVSIKHVSMVPFEDEILISRKSKFRVKKIVVDNKEKPPIHTIHLEEHFAKSIGDIIQKKVGKEKTKVNKQMTIQEKWAFDSNLITIEPATPTKSLQETIEDLVRKELKKRNINIRKG